MAIEKFVLISFREKEVDNLVYLKLINKTKFYLGNKENRAKFSESIS
jgi:hypothetical protein